jgi:hypothetical protein
MLKLLVTSAVSYRCCLTPFGVAASAISTCYLFGTFVFGIPAGHMGLELFLAITAVVVHLCLHETILRLRRQTIPSSTPTDE